MVTSVSVSLTSQPDLAAPLGAPGAVVAAARRVYLAACGGSRRGRRRTQCAGLDDPRPQPSRSRTATRASSYCAISSSQSSAVVCALFTMPTPWPAEKIFL